MRDVRIPFNRPEAMGREHANIAEALASGYLAGDGPFARRCVRELEAATGARHVFLTPSGTAALELIGMLADLSPGDEVIVPSFTFPSTVLPIVARRAVPRFADVRWDTANLDERLVEALIGPRTKAVMAMHYAGVACEMETLTTICQAHSLRLYEDNAHGLLGTYRGQPLGTFGALAAQSFHETKNVQCGEGGALLVNDTALLSRTEVLREKGTNRQRFFRGEVDKYTWVDDGTSSLVSELQAAYLLGQLQARSEIQARRHRVWATYHRELAEWADAVGARQPHVPPDAEHPAHLYYLVLASGEDRDRFIDHMRGEGVQCVFHYQALSASAMGRSLGAKIGDCPVSEVLSERLVRLPLFAGLTEAELELIIAAAKRFTPVGHGSIG